MTTKIRRGTIHEIVFREIAWPANENLNALLAGMMEINQELALALDEEVNAYAIAAAEAAFRAGFLAGCHPERILFEESNAEYQ